MKLNKSAVITYILIIGFNMIISSCSLSPKISDNYNPDINTKHLQHINTNSKKNNFTINQSTQFTEQDLQTINFIYFPFNKYHVLPTFFDILDVHVNYLRSDPFLKIKIEGHTDERGTPEYNIALGERRAYSVKIYLQSKGILPNQMYTISYGKEKPIDFNHTEEAYAKNRRVVLSYQ